MEKQEIHDKAWNLLGDKGLKLGDKMMVRAAFVTWSGYKEEYPFIQSYWDLDKENEYFHSTYEMIKSYIFKTKEEVILANAIYLNMNEINGTNEFTQMFKFTCRVIGLNSDWS